MRGMRPVRCFAGIPSIESRAMEKAEMKRMFAFLVLWVASNAHAIPIGGTVPPSVPIELDRKYEVTLGSGGYAVSYAEDTSSNGPIGQLASQLTTVPSQIENTLNGIIARQAAHYDGIFLGGSLTGNPMVQIAPKADGTALMTLSGVGYGTSVKKKIEVLGITVFSCTARLQVDNVSIVAQYGSVDGQIRDESVGFNGQPNVDTNCNSFLSWLLPGIGSYLTNRVEGLADRALLDGIKSAMNTVKDKLLLSPDQNFLRGLNALIPVDKTIPLPNGSVLPIGQYVHDNVAYLAARSTLTMQLSRGLTSLSPPWYGYVGTAEDSVDVLYLSLDSPVVSFDLMLAEKATVSWEQTCLHPEYYGEIVEFCP